MFTVLKTDFSLTVTSAFLLQNSLKESLELNTSKHKKLTIFLIIQRIQLFKSTVCALLSITLLSKHFTYLLIILFTRPLIKIVSLIQ